MAGDLVPLLWLLLTFGRSLEAAPAADLVTDLPDVDFSLNFDQYSGYLDGDTGNHFHYWFVESQNDPTTDPLVLWLTGGPGCSALDALLVENGPIHIYDNGTLYSNPYAWNTIANVLYIESPVGVGFSYSDSGDYSSTDDDTVSLNNYIVLQNFLTSFPEFSGRDFYLAGESYSGVYIPTLALRILNGDLNVSFQGFAIGNPLLNDELNDNSVMFYGRYHGLIGESTWEDLVSLCCGGVESRDACDFTSVRPLDCSLKVIQAEEQLYANGLNPYNILSPCQYPTTATFARRLQFRKLKKALKDLNLEIPKRPEDAVGSDPTCITTTAIDAWLNEADVRTSLHISDQALPWTLCSDDVADGYQTLYDDMTDQFNELLPSVRALIYNGDFDTVCNFLGDQWFVENLNRTVVKDYDYWTDADGIVAGYGKAYDKLQFTTIRGSGHLVPQDQPARALLMFRKFLNNRDF